MSDKIDCALASLRIALEKPPTDASAMQEARLAFRWLDGELSTGSSHLPEDWQHGVKVRRFVDTGEPVD